MLTPAKCEKCGSYPGTSKAHELFEGIILCPKCVKEIEYKRFLSSGKTATCRICSRLYLMTMPSKDHICPGCKEELSRPNCRRCDQKMIWRAWNRTTGSVFHDAPQYDWWCSNCEEIAKEEDFLKREQRKRLHRLAFLLLGMIAFLLVIFFLRML